MVRARPCASCKYSAGFLGSSAGQVEDGDVPRCLLPSQGGCAVLGTSSDKLACAGSGRAWQGLGLWDSFWALGQLLAGCHLLSLGAVPWSSALWDVS